jgi:hypothetical protein
MELIVTDDGKVFDGNGKEIVDDGTLDELTKAFIEAWNTGKEG